MDSKKGILKIVPIGGLGEIGMNCMLLEYEGQGILLDCGLQFVQLSPYGIDYVVPNFDSVVEKQDKLLGVVLTHGHEDHIGAVPAAIRRGISRPFYGSPFTLGLVQEKLIDQEMEGAVPLRTFHKGERFTVGPFKILPLHVTHSMIESSGMLIEVGPYRLLHTGDFRIDRSPYLDAPLEANPFETIGAKGVDLMMSDSTNVEVSEHQPSESTIRPKLETVFKESKGLTLVALFSSNVARIAQIFDSARALNKKVAMIGRSLNRNIEVARANGYLRDIDDLLIKSGDVQLYPRSQVVVIVTGSQGEHRSALARIARGDHSDIELIPGDVVAFSSKKIPGNELAISRILNLIYQSGAQVIAGDHEGIHVSGHASAPELKEMLEWVKPRIFLPVHGEYRFLVKHAELARTLDSDLQTLVAVNGDVLELSKETLKKVDTIDVPPLLIDNESLRFVPKDTLRERRKIGESGVVFATFEYRATKQEILSLDAIGTQTEGIPGNYLDRIRREAQGLLHEVFAEEGIDSDEYEAQLDDIEEDLRISIRRNLGSLLKKRPIVIVRAIRSKRP